MGEKTETVLIRVTPERKSQWTDAAEARGNTLTAYIRHCVHQEQLDTAPETDTSGIERRLDDIEQALSGGAGSVTHRLQAIEGELQTDSSNIESEVYGLLPTELPTREGAMYEESSHTELSGKPEHIADHIHGASVDDVRHALDGLNELHNVHRIETETGTRWYHD